MSFDRIIALRNNKTVYRDGERTVKIFDRGYPKTDVLNEALNQARAETLGLRVPRVDEVTVTDDGRYAIVSEYVDGTGLDRLMAEKPDKKDEYLRKFVELQSQINSKTCNELRKQRDNLSRRICETDLKATERFDLHMRLEDMPKNNKVCHGDFDPTNVVVTESGEMCILDWSHVSEGEPCADAARTYLLFLYEGDEECAEKYLDLFCEINSRTRDDVCAWLPIVAAAGMASGGAEERAFLREQYERTVCL